MSITNLERRIRFSNFTSADYDMVANDYMHRMFPILMESKEFVATLESKTSHVMSKRQMEQEANSLALSGHPVIADFGKAVKQFLANGVQTVDQLLIAISAVVLAGGVALSICILLIIAVILYAVTIIPAGTLIAALTVQYNSMNKYLEKPKDKNVITYKTLVKNIMNKKEGVRDIQGLSKAINISESVRYVVECDAMTPNENTEIHNFCSIIRAIDARINEVDNDCEQALALEMQLFGDLAPSDRVYQNTSDVPILESVNMGSDDGTELFMTFENVLSQPMLSGDGLLHGITCIVTDAADKTSILEFLNRYKETAKYEFTHENYSDIPLIKATASVLEFMGLRCGDNPEMMESIQNMNQLCGEIIDEAFNEVTEDAAQGGPAVTCANPSTTEVGFNPNPFDIGSLTPFPVASRKVGSILCDVTRAETDDEITEAMLNLSRVSTIIEEHYTVESNDAEGYVVIESKAGKVARRASDKVSGEFSKAATKDKTEGVGAAIKRTIDPMEKFIQKQYDTLREKDANERRNVILKGGSVPKIMRWIKRGIGLLAGAAVGKLIPAAAIVTGIVFIGFVATDKYLDHKERAKILRELEDEIQICNEKIDDSRGDDNKQNKYELMRIRNQLTRTSEKIRLGLKY